MGEDLAIYKKLYAEQQDIIEKRLDLDGLQYGLGAFPSLQRVTVTSEAHRLYLGSPCYETPLIRSFPQSFNYLLPWPWLSDELFSELYEDKNLGRCTRILAWLYSST